MSSDRHKKEGLLFVVSAPAGTGKTTLVARLTKEFAPVVTSVSFTTRKPRPGEVEGVHYHFIGPEEFKAKVARHEFLEHVELYGDYYGTSKIWVQEQLSHGNHVILTIDTQGALILQKNDKMKAVYIFIQPPSLEELRKRLKKRKTESHEVIEERLEWAKKEMMQAKHYDYVVVNDVLDKACDILRSIVIAEEHKNRTHLPRR